MTYTGFRWKDRRCLVTGAFGFVGTHLCQYLVSRGARVTALDCLADTGGTFFGTTELKRQVRILGADVRSRRQLRVLDDLELDCVFHLAAQPVAPLSAIDPEGTIEINAVGTANVGRAVSTRARPPTFVFASSACWYGASARSPLTEDEPYCEAEFPYSESKVLAEEEVLRLETACGIPTVRCRFVNLYGPGDRHFSRIVPKTIRHLLRGEDPCLSRNDGTTVLDFMYVTDAAAALAKAAELAAECRGEVFNFGVGGNHPVEARGVLRKISQAFDGRDREPLLRNPQRPKTARKYLANTKAKERLGWRPTMTLGQGLQPTLEWYRMRMDQIEPLEF